MLLFGVLNSMDKLNAIHGDIIEPVLSDQHALIAYAIIACVNAYQPSS